MARDAGGAAIIVIVVGILVAAQLPLHMVHGDLHCTVDRDYGCYVDAVTPQRTLPHHAANAGSHEECAHNCYRLGFIGTAGMENGEECWCSNNYGPVGSAVASWECNTRCSDEWSQQCGGLSRLNQFSFSCSHGPIYYSCSGGRCAEDPRGQWADPNCNGACATTTWTSLHTTHWRSTSPSPDASSNRPIGEVLGIVFGAAAALLVVVAGVYLYVRRRRRGQRYQPVPTDPGSNTQQPHGGEGGSLPLPPQVPHPHPPPAHTAMSAGPVAPQASAQGVYPLATLPSDATGWSPALPGSIHFTGHGPPGPSDNPPHHGLFP